MNFKDEKEDNQLQTALLNENKSIEILKRKHEKEVIILIHNELRNEIQRRQNKKNLMAQREDDENFLYGHQMNDSRIDLIEKDSERLKNLELKSRQDDYKKTIERIFQERKSKIVERQKKYDEKEEERRMIIEQKSKNQHFKSIKKKEEKIKRVEITMKNLEEKARQRSEDLEVKQLQNETKRIEFEESRHLKFSKTKEEAMKKGEKIVQVIEKNKELEKRKIKEYYDKQDIISLRKEKLEEAIFEEKKLKMEKRKERHLRIEEVKI